MKRLVPLLIFMFVIGMFPSSVAAAAKPTTAKTTAPLGIDVAWPQCGQKLPTNHAFGIVGINDGLATTTNPCLSDQLTWASRAIGGTPQDKVQLYVNTANPGGLNTLSWPASNTDPSGNLSPNPYGTCDKKDTLACAWQYGWNRAVEDVTIRFAPAAAQAGIVDDPSKYIWWLDVETENTWKPAGPTFNHDSNVAVLEGMTAYFQSLDARVGLYSTSVQWKEIVGARVSTTSSLNGLDNWRPGGASLSTAKQACSASPLTPGGKVVLTQFVSRGLDYNYSCV